MYSTLIYDGRLVQQPSETSAWVFIYKHQVRSPKLIHVSSEQVVANTIPNLIRRFKCTRQMGNSTRNENGTHEFNKSRLRA